MARAASCSRACSSKVTAVAETSTYHLRVQAPDGAQLPFWVTAHVTFAQHAPEPTVEFFTVRCTAR